MVTSGVGFPGTAPGLALEAPQGTPHPGQTGMVGHPTFDSVLTANSFFTT